uniref:Rho guanine nucleotide exchange factor (GEF) 7b n=1 Tax=Gadus morhua TaxID=8049 RepID=A0A8C5AVN6_GADMO
MNSAEQTVTWLITLGVLDSPKKRISDPESFLQSSLRDGVVLCRLLERLRPGTVLGKVFSDPRAESECQSNISEFLQVCSVFSVEPFEASDLLQGQDISRVLTCLVALNKATEAERGPVEDDVCLRHPISSSRIKSFESLNTQCQSSKLLQPQYRSLDMSEGSGCGQTLVKARFPFQQTNEDELSFSKGDLITVLRQEEGGWWEGALGGRTGWFPNNYVREVKDSEKLLSPRSGTLKSPPKGFDTTIVNKTYYNVVLQNILETESEYSRELQSLLVSYLRSLHPTEKLCSPDIALIQGNLEEISTFQQMLVQSLEERTKLPEAQQRVGGFFLGLMSQMKTLYMAYCSNHPSAVNVLTQHSEELGAYMESKGACVPGILTLTTGLSKAFTRLDRYPTLLKELDRHMEDHHPDRADLHTCMTAFKLLSQCLEVRKRKELELQILTEPIRNWEGDDIRTLGPVLHMVQTGVFTQGCLVIRTPHSSQITVVISIITSGRIPLSGMLISRMEDGDNIRNAFEISGEGTCSHGVVIVSAFSLVSVHPTPHPATPSRHSESCGGGGGGPFGFGGGTPTGYHTLPHMAPSSTPTYGSFGGGSVWGSLEPPSSPRPWSQSCLRPAPPLRPSATLCYKEDQNKSPKNMKKLLPKRKPERKPSEEDFTARKSTAALEEDAQILKVIEAYCTSARTRQTLNSTWQGTDLMHNHVLADAHLVVTVDAATAPATGAVPCADQSEDSENDSVWISPSYRMMSLQRKKTTLLRSVFISCPCRSLVDTVYGLRDEVQDLKQDNKRMRRTLEEEQRARKEMERVVRRVLKNLNDPSWDETNL